MLTLEFLTQVLTFKFFKLESSFITHGIRKNCFFSLKSLSSLDDLINKSLLLVIELVEGDIESIPKALNVSLQMFKVVLQEFVPCKINAVDRGSIIRINCLLGDLVLIHLVALGSGKLINIKVRSQEWVKLVGDNLIKALLRRYVLELIDVSNLLSDREYFFSLNFALIKWITELFQVFSFSVPVFLIKDDSLLFAKVINLALNSILDQSFTLVQALYQGVIGVGEFSAREVLQLLEWIYLSFRIQLCVKLGKGLLIQVLTVLSQVRDGVFQKVLVLGKLGGNVSS